ncbi:D-alanyl-D-alanine carboxypeptidase family protein [Oribacterium sp. P6A1]|uniref:D-alanyl-D-alanine carboxypeptidase family protein n=1 Tax=Oribacterium sp. P6A1 TaxID=1410612 RepID=UPI0012DC277F|nr:D-alanyl-D-alanine carboxypeptidase family protein [Oribacterium sp. P6A1]
MMQRTDKLKAIKKFGRRVVLTLSATFLITNSIQTYNISGTSLNGINYPYPQSERVVNKVLNTLKLMPITGFAAVSWPQASFSLNSEGAILIDADSNAILYEKNSTTAYYPASITKVLTAILVLENCTNLDDKVTFSYAAVNGNLEPNSTIIGAVPGDKLSVRDCLYCLLLHSANDCANALAEYIAGSNEKFADMMNAKAAEIGCVNSHFVNPSGLNDPDHYTCAYDFAKIMQYAIKNDTFKAIDASQVYTHAPISKYPNDTDSENTVYAHHHMMRKSYAEYYPGVFAGKTGYTILAGNTLVTACEKNGMTLICVILNGHNSQYTDTKNLFDFGYTNFKSIEAAAYDKNISTLSSNFKVDGIQIIDSLSFDIPSSYHITIPSEAVFEDVSGTINYDLNDSEKSGGAFARIDYVYGDKSVGNAYISLSDHSDKIIETQQTSQTDANTEETVPESISMNYNEDTHPTVSGQLPAESDENHAPIVLNQEEGRIEIPKPIKRLVSILAVIGLIALLIFGIYYLMERHEEFIRKKRRSRMLKHTDDLSIEQKARRDMLLNSRSRKRSRKK